MRSEEQKSPISLDAEKCEHCPAGFYNNATKQSHCVRCRVGESANEGSARCEQCRPGLYSSELGQSSCTKCSAGQIQPTSGSAGCTLLPTSSIALGGAAASVDVPAGSYLTNCKGKDLQTCEGFSSCPAGWIGKEVELIQKCFKCEKGKSSFKGTTECRTCTKGKFTLNSGSGLCKKCPKGWFQPQDTKPSMKCEKCPSGWGAIQDENDGKGSPVCLDLNWKKSKDCTTDQYLDNRVLNNPSNWSCVTCPQGGACNGPITWYTLGPLFGWWKLPESERPSDKLMFTKCLHPPACLGSANPDFRGKFRDKHGTDLSKKVVNATNTTCAIHLGFRNESRLCHTCSSTNRRKG